MLCDSVYMIFWKRQKCGQRQISGFQGARGCPRGQELTKKDHRGILGKGGDEKILIFFNRVVIT